MPIPPDRVRPGFVIHEVLSGQEPLRVWARDAEGHRTPSAPTHVAQATITDLHQEFKIRIRALNVDRRTGNPHDRLPPLRGMAYSSFKDYCQKALRIGLLQVVGTEPAAQVRGMDALARREFVALGPLGGRLDLWGNVSKAYMARVETAPTTIVRPGVGAGMGADRMRQAPRQPHDKSDDLQLSIDEAVAALQKLSRPNIASGRAWLKKLAAQGINVSDARDSLEHDYNDLVKSDFEDAEAYADERVTAWEAFITTLEETEIEP